MTANTIVARHATGALRAAIIIELTAATAYIHLSLGGTLFLLNALGYTVLAVAYAISAAAPIPIVQRLSWLPPIGLAAYTLVTIGAYLLTGSYFTLGWIAKAIEVAIVGLIMVDLLSVYGSPRGLIRTAKDSLTRHALRAR